MPRFVILEHDHPQLHWDFMLEAKEVLRTWKLDMPPQVGQTINAELSFDHRLIYLDYEGPLSNNRGSATRWDTGTFNWQNDTKDHVLIDLKGNRCSGAVELRRGSNDQWQALFTAVQ